MVDSQYLYCYGKCIPVSFQRGALPETDETDSACSKRELVLPEDNTAVARYLVGRPNGWKRNGDLLVFHNDCHPADSAQFRVLGDEPVEVVLNGAGECTAFAVVSQSAVYFAYSFEGSSLYRITISPTRNWVPTRGNLEDIWSNDYNV
ncbi:hypothetical protein BJX63DRAFT_431938 [Aspergillus granulosus]|uniref:Uncharacterized protein n=1 Tax=Aspergillus granulosus TaxID=176169 RepID=A0ABR4HFQ7_9EURO